MKMEQTECSEMSSYKIQTTGNYPEENIHSTGHVICCHYQMLPRAPRWN